MDSLKLKDVFEKFIDNNIKTMLIDGPWGCGKTYYAKEFMKNMSENINYNILYVSIFGYSSVEDINTDLFYQLNSGIKNAENCLKVVSKVANALPIIGAKFVKTAADGLNYALNLFNREELDSNTIIIFDDLERMNKNLKMSDFFGYIFHLLLNKIRIIVLCDSNNIEVKDEFQAYKEKIFDRVIIINEPNKTVLNNYYSKYNLINTNDLFAIFEKNLRNAERSVCLLEQVLSIINNNKIIIKNEYTNDAFAVATALVIKISLYNYPKGEVPEIDDKIYLSYRKLFDKDLVNKITYELNTLKDNQGEYSYPVRSLIVPILEYYLHDDTTYLIEKVRINDNQKDYDILNERIFYLSDNDKKEFYDKFVKQLNNTKELSKNDISNFVAILSYYPFLVKDSLYEIFFEKYKEYNTEGFDDIQDLEYNLKIIDNKERREKVFGYIDKLKLEFVTKLKKDILFNLEKGQYDLVISQFHIIMYQNIYNNELIEFIKNNKFLLPDISNTLTQRMWSYCNNIVADFKTLGLDNEFILYSKSVCNKNKNNKSLIERFKSLIFYKLQKNITEEELISDMKKSID